MEKILQHIFLSTGLVLLASGCSGALGGLQPTRELPTQTIAAPAAGSVPTTRANPAPSVAPEPTPIATLAQKGEAMVPAAFKKFLNNVQIEIQGDMISVKSNGVPPHPSPYFARGSSNYQPYNGSNPAYRQNPNQIREQTLAISLPLNPRQADRHAPTPLGPIGIALDSVALFNQYAGPNQPLTVEINSFDQFNGHPMQEGMYHYHVEPLFLTNKFGKDTLIGFLLDGFPVYGPLENSKSITNRDLDEFHGHTHSTADYPNGIYHYHVTNDAPYINGNGFYGTAGRVNWAR
jgi:hypothetical protein